MIQAMKPSLSHCKADEPVEHAVDGGHDAGSCLLRSVGWVAAGLTAVALGVVIGREIHQRYKFNRRTPYDLYAHSGDQTQDVEFGVGI